MRILILRKFFFTVLISVGLPAVVLAAAIQVNDLNDNTTADDDNCTLREAILNANSDSDTTSGDCAAGSDPDTITFTVTGTITLGSQLVISSDLSINGPGADVLTISGNDGTRIFKVEVADVSISGLTISNGATTVIGDENGGGINNAGTLTVSNSSFSDNRAGGSGGAIYNTGTLIVTSSAFLTNSSHLSGGAIYNGGTLSVTNSTFFGNDADPGGAIYSSAPVAATITNSTFSGNSALDFFGAAIFGQTEIILLNSIIANTTNSRNCNGLITDGGNNLQFGSFPEVPSSCPASIPTTATDPLGGNTPDDNGGPTKTIALPLDSPAIDAYCNTGGCGTTVITDQRGEPRPADGNGDGIAECDIGAFELQPSSPTCPHGKGFWKNAEDWPVASLTVGDELYTKAELVSVLRLKVKKDASLILAKQLIAAKLNVANGSDDSVLTLIAEADNLLAPFSGKLPYSVKPSSGTGQSMVSLAKELERYNKGLLTDGCHP